MGIFFILSFWAVYFWLSKCMYTDGENITDLNMAVLGKNGSNHCISTFFLMNYSSWNSEVGLDYFVGFKTKWWLFFFYYCYVIYTTFPLSNVLDVRLLQSKCKDSDQFNLNSCWKFIFLMIFNVIKMPSLLWNNVLMYFKSLLKVFKI